MKNSEHGEYADHGYVMPGQWRYSMNDDTLDHANQDYSMSLREALDLAIPDQCNGSWPKPPRTAAIIARSGTARHPAQYHPGQLCIKRLLGAR
jgi:hypothetical protein